MVREIQLKKEIKANNMNSNKYFYRVKLSIKEIPGEEDLLDIQDFKRDYLFNSKDFAEAKFKKGSSGIKSGSYKNKLPKTNKDSATFDIILCLVEELNGNLIEHPLREFEKSFEENLKMERSILDQEIAAVHKEKTKGFVRHSAPVTGNYFFQQKIKSKLNGIEKNTTKDFQEMECAVYSHYNELEGMDRYSPEEGDHLEVQLFLVDQTRNKHVENLMYHNRKKDELTIALAEELIDKQYLESSAEKSPLTFSPRFGRRPSLWEIEARNPILESAPAGVGYRVTREVVKSTSEVVSDFVITEFKEEEGKSFFDLVTYAEAFYKAKILEVKTKLGSEDDFDYFIRVIFSIVKDDRIRNLYYPNTLEPCPGAKEFQEKVLRERRNSLNQFISVSDAVYKNYQAISDILKTVHFTHYCVFQGTSYEESRKKKRFFHHDLRTARQQAFVFYDELLLEREEQKVGNDSENAPIALVLDSPYWRDCPFYIKSTAPPRYKDIRVGLSEEADVYRKLGFSIETLK